MFVGYPWWTDDVMCPCLGFRIGCVFISLSNPTPKLCVLTFYYASMVLPHYIFCFNLEKLYLSTEKLDINGIFIDEKFYMYIPKVTFRLRLCIDKRDVHNKKFRGKKKKLEVFVTVEFDSILRLDNVRWLSTNNNTLHCLMKDVYNKKNLKDYNWFFTFVFDGCL